MSDDVIKRRRIAATLIVAAIVLAAPASSLVLGRQAAEHSGEAASALHASSIVCETDPLATLSALEEAVAIDDAAPAYFLEEIGLVDGAYDVRASADGRVVGYSVDLDAQKAEQALTTLMSQSGWSEVPLGQDGAATFVKDDGRCTWALVTCTQAEGATCIVYRCVVA